MEEKQFVTGFWNYKSAPDCTREQIALWADCGINMSVCLHYDPDKHGPETMRRVLDDCADYHIRVVAADSRTHHSRARDLTAYREGFAQAVREYGDHPALFGFFLGDEPPAGDMHLCVEAAKVSRELAPRLIPFLDLCPCRPGSEQLHMVGGKFGAWSPELIRDADFGLMCYYNYSQMMPEEEGTQEYFLSLRTYKQLAEQAGVPLWTSLLSVGHFRYRVPSEDDLRWQLNSAAACGLKGALFFTFYTSMSNNYRTGPIDEFGRKTETYDRLRRVLSRFHYDYGPLLARSTLKKAYCVNKSYGGYPIYDGSNKTVKSLESMHSLPAMISFFEDEDGTEYVLALNNSPFESDMFVLNLPKTVKRILRVRKNGASLTDFAASHWDAYYEVTQDLIRAGVWLAPGQFEIFRLEN